MAEPYNEQFLTKLHLFVKAASVAIILGGCASIAGWQFDIAALRSLGPGFTAMNPGSTAIGFLLTGWALWGRQAGVPHRLKYQAHICAFGILAIAICWIVVRWLGCDCGMDQMLYRDKLHMEALLTGRPNRMAPNTAATFLLAGLALLFLDVKYRRIRIWPAQFLAVGVILSSLLTLIGYLYNSISLIGFKNFTPMAPNTATLFLLTGGAILCLRPKRGLMAIISGAGAGGMQARRLLPLIVAIPASVGLIEEHAQSAGLLDQALLLPVFALTNIVALAALIWWGSASVGKLDRQRRHAEEDLQKEKAASDKANQAKSEFLANMSHELRTPLNSIIGLNRMLYEDKTLDAEHKEMVGISFRAATNLLNIVNDILDLSKIEAGALELEKIIFSPEEVANNIMEVFLPLCSQKGLALTCDFATGTAPYLVGDPLRLGRIMLNLVSNAVKYTEKGSIKIDISFSPAGPDYLTMDCGVTDTGIGIPADRLDRIFDKFMQADSSITRKYGGTGLGLNIAQHLTAQMGGQMGVESAEGVGSRFWFRIPFPTSEIRPMLDKRIFQGQHPDRLPEERRKRMEDISILVGEDHLLNQEYVTRLLARMGLGNHHIVDSGKMILEALDRKSYDLILMDCHMPLLSGYEATKAIRLKEKETENHVPIIAMTADAMPGTRERCLISGMDDYISKPINPDELRHIMSRWVTFADDDSADGPHEAAAALGGAFGLPTLMAFAKSDDDLRRLQEVFVRQSEHTLEGLRNNRSDGENAAWVEAAHKLMGSATAAKAEKLRAACERAQEMANAAAIQRQAIFDEICAAYDEVKKILLEEKWHG